MNQRGEVEALIIVAHPDDETIWMSGTILQNPDWVWTIISLSRADDEDRAPKFRRVCEYFNAKGIISDLDDEHMRPLDVDQVIEKIKSLLPKQEYSRIFTHGSNGEYGHLRHKEVHRAVKKMLSDGDLKAEKVFFFAYQNSSRSTPGIPDLKIQEPHDDANLRITLKENELKEKIKIITEFYGFNNANFETLCCHNPQEAFVLFDENEWRGEGISNEEGKEGVAENGRGGGK